MNNKELKEDLIDRFKKLNQFIRDLEDFYFHHEISKDTDLIYAAAIAQRKLLKDILKL